MTNPKSTRTRKSCTCPSCVSCCERKPGWMKPGEAEKIADFLGVSLTELFAQYLAVDWWVDYPDVFLLSPALARARSGTEMPYVAQGRCTFLTPEGRCSIHPVKPFECKTAWCGDGAVEVGKSAHKKAADAWRPKKHQAQIAKLLGREPETSGGDLFSFMGLDDDA